MSYFKFNFYHPGWSGDPEDLVYFIQAEDISKALQIARMQAIVDGYALTRLVKGREVSKHEYDRSS